MEIVEIALSLNKLLILRSHQSALVTFNQSDRPILAFITNVAFCMTFRMECVLAIKKPVATSTIDCFGAFCAICGLEHIFSIGNIV
jgi:hypothetical protein